MCACVHAWRERTRMPNFGLMSLAAIGERRTRWGSAAAAGRMRGEHVEIRHRRELSTMAARDDTRTELGRRQQRKKDKWCDCAKHRILTIQESA